MFIGVFEQYFVDASRLRFILKNFDKNSILISFFKFKLKMFSCVL